MLSAKESSLTKNKVSTIEREKMSETVYKTMPWVEKYRPDSLNDLVSQGEIVTTVQRFIAEKKLPHLLFYGPPGTGKTSTVLALAKKMYGPKYKSMILELNASDDRGINVVREKIKSFASTRTIFSAGFKLIILDEADHMTNTAQAALRRVIEKYTKNVRFCLICNYLSKIIPAIQSRCTSFRFQPLVAKDITSRIQHIADTEKTTLTDDGMEALLRLSKGDMRRVLNILQAASMTNSTVDEEILYNCTGQPLPKDIANIVDWMLNSPLTVAYKNIIDLKILKSLATSDLLTEIHSFVCKIELPSDCLISLLDDLATIECRLATATSDEIQLTAMIAAFIKCREMVGAAC